MNLKTITQQVIDSIYHLLAERKTYSNIYALSFCQCLYCHHE